MIVAIRTFLAGAWGYIVAGGVALVAFFAFLASVKKSGRDEVRAASAEKELEHAKQANEIDERVAVTPPDDRRERLRKYQRD